jgi:hypothetical protein
MTQSESIDKLYPAFIAFQAEVPSVLKDGNNPHFKSKYATLPAITESVRPYLAKHGLGFTQSLAYRDGVQLIFTRVMHTSGQWMEDEGYVLNPTKNDPQGMASAVTYARRNTLGATCGIVTEDDDDGNAASAPRPQPAKQPATDLPPLNATNADGTLNSKGLESASFIAGGGTFEQIERKYRVSITDRKAVNDEAIRMRMDATDKTKQGNASQLIAQANEIGDGLPW